ncbi:NAD(P)-dependent oxidoreductase [Paenibacillus sp. MMS20-IR301]|uniref:NAD-dependent epimerase/dehydratase family protein n=1 Tax=Paenibacillus sp. MMS20-IR301 TaxID=2895946 RepID=UPI0028EA0A0E|nr:NAD(P)-dependent oxidoreductase [Paenibacillus sp. MMS20-IR301]WNS43345.1 NAD(P)-dependent oxidoreductase [Paenibacillus sp. MMS20-IR301]
METIAVTGGSGKLGSAVIRALQHAGYGAVSIDRRTSGELSCRQLIVDLSDLGQLASALQGADAVIHLAAIPAPLLYPPAHIFTNNVLSGYNVLEAAGLLGIRRVVLGSSESSYGFAWAPQPFSPEYVPVDEQHPQQPRECYGLSKVVNEATAAMFSRRGGMKTVSLRFSTVMTEAEYAHIQPAQPERYVRTLWSYIDIRDAAAACLAALKHGEAAPGNLNITADDTLSAWPTDRLLNEFYPEVLDRRSRFEGREAVVSNRLAKETLHWQPRYSWMEGRQASQT